MDIRKKKPLTVRINKFIASNTGVSRRAADQIVKEGRVSLNGKTVTNLATTVNETDNVSIDGKKVKKVNDAKVYIMLNKPSGYITSVKPEGGFKTVMELIRKETFKFKHIFPVGRLDFMSEGLLLLTNDGDFSYNLTHPKFDILKTYIVEGKGELTDDLFHRIKKGVSIEGSGLLKPENLEIVQRNKTKFILKFVLSGGKNREIRRLLEFFNIKVNSLKRVSIGSLILEGIPSGEYRILNRKAAESALIKPLKQDRNIKAKAGRLRPANKHETK